MRHLGILFLVFAIILFVSTIDVSESGHGHHKGHRSNHYKISKKVKRSVTDEATKLKLPGIIRRKFVEYSRAPANFTALYHSIPVTMEHIKDDLFRITAPYRKTNSTILKIQLWMEFPLINKTPELMNNEFVIDIVPVIGSRDMDGYDDDCSLLTLVSKPRFPEDILEMKFDIKSLYQACQIKDEASSLNYKIRFYPIESTSDINLAKDKVDMFLIFKEHDDIEDISHFLPHSKHLGPLHYDKIINRKPHLKSFVPKRKFPKTCSLRPFTFSFHYSGWKDFVIAPKDYQSNKCHGRCAFPLPGHLNYTNYAVIKAVGSTIYKELKNPCCIAQDLAPLSMLVSDEQNKITLKSQKDLIVTSCKCG